jgi:hypothetical protein
MRRRDKEIQDGKLIDQILAKAGVLRLGLSKDNRAYIVPVSFGYDGSFLYFHTARQGMKIDYIASNRHVCFELEHDVHVIENETDACRWSQSFFSVIGHGTVEEITESGQKVRALNQIMKHYSGREWAFDERVLDKPRLWRISIDRMTGKKSPDKKTIG